MSYLFADEGARQSNNGPEENATAQDDLSVEAVAQVTEDGSCHHETADEDCRREKGEKPQSVYSDRIKVTAAETYLSYSCAQIQFPSL